MTADRDDPEETYEQVLASVDPDALHDVLVRKGLEALRRGVPYLVVAARWQKRSRDRTERRRQTILERSAPHDAPSSLDPYDLVVRNETLRRLVEALAGLADEDVIIVVAHFAGHSDGEIRDRLSPERARLTLQAIRKRRERALKRLRTILEDRKADGGS